MASSLPPPPGLSKPSLPTSTSSSSSGIPSAHPSLPARPTAPAAPLPSFKPAFPPSSSAGAPGTRSYGSGDGNKSSGFGGAMGFKPRSIATQQSQHQPPTYSSPSVSTTPVTPTSGYSVPPAMGYGNEGGPYNQGTLYQQQPTNYYAQQQQQQQQQQPQGQAAQSGDAYSRSQAPHIQNPFPMPGQEGYGRGKGKSYGEHGYDHEMEAQIAQWQSAYMNKDEAALLKNPAGRGRGEGSGNANTVPLGTRGGPVTTGNIDVGNAAVPDSGVAAVVAGADGKQKTVLRSGGGKSWQDPSLLEWDPSHPRLFIGNLAGEITDDSLLKAFSRYPSVQKARVIRDKRTTKSKGYGFVSFGNSDDYFQAAKEMQGKYIGSHPVLIKRSNTEIKATVPQPKGKFGKGSGAGSSGGGVGAGGGGGPGTGAGIQKKQSKKKGGLKILG